MSALAAVAVSLSAMADADFITHRYESFKACPAKAGSVAFIGNSITNMGNWHEHFGDNPLAQNRGNSGACSYEALANIETVIAGRPSQIYVMIGTNDIGSATGTPKTIAANGRALIERVKNESPETRVHIVSTFPSTNGLRTVENHTEINNLLKQVCQETGAEFIDLWNDMQGIVNGSISSDRLHVTAKGYYIWSTALVPYLGQGWTCTLPENTEARNNYVWANGNGLRVNMLATLPVKADDVLMIGGEMINNGEWHELLANPHVKNRGATYGYGDYLSANWKDFVKYIFDLNKPTKQTPAQIYINIGSQDINTGADIATLKANYREIVDNVIERAPGSQIRLTALTPHSNAAKNTTTREFNAFVSELASEKGLTYVDLFTPMALDGGAPNPKYITTNLNAPYASAAGYLQLARTLAPYIGSCTVESEADFDARYELLQARTALGNLVSATYTAVTGDVTGMIDPAALQKLTDVRQEIYDILNKEGVTASELNAAYEKYLPIANEAARLNQPSHGQIYHIVTHRGNRMVNISAQTTLVSTPMAEADPHSPAFIWRMEQRQDGSWNIINRLHEKFLSPTITVTDAEPAAGWTFTDHSTTGTYAIASGNIQFHQLNNGGLTNWGGGSNLSDLGCAFYLNAIDDDFVIVDPEKVQTVDYPVASDDYKDVLFNFKSVRGPKYASEAAAGNWILGSDDAASDNSTWRLYLRSDDSYDIKNVATGHYIDPDNQNSTVGNQFMASEQAPANGWDFRPIEGGNGTYVITSGSNIQLHQAKSPWRIINWGFNSLGDNAFRTNDEGCQYFLQGRIVRDDTPHSLIREVSKANEPAVHYDLQGRRISPTQSGLHITPQGKIRVK